MKYQDMCVKKTWTQNGEEKVKWLKVGTLRTMDDGRIFAELNHMPNDGIFVFDQREKGEKAQTTQIVQESAPADGGDF